MSGDAPMTTNVALYDELAYDQVKDFASITLAVSSGQRCPAMSDVPTVAESGFPGFEAVACFGFLVPAGAPDAIIRTVRSNVVKTVENADVRAWLENAGLEMVGNTPE